MLVFLVAISLIGFVGNASAYNLEGGKWQDKLNIGYWFMNLTTLDYPDVRMAVSNVEDAPADFHLVQDYTYRDIEYYSVRRSDVSWAGQCEYNPP